MPNLAGRLPTSDATRIPVSRSKGQRSGSLGPLTLTHIVCHIFRMARPTNFKLGIRMEDDDLHQPRRHNLQDQKSRSQGHMISLSCVGPVVRKSKTISRSITKIDKRVLRDTCYIAHQFQYQQVKAQGHRPINADAQNVQYLPNGKA